MASVTVLDVILGVLYDLLKEIKQVFDDVQRNKELLEDLKKKSESIERIIDNIKKWQNRLTDTEIVEQSLEKVRIAFENAKYVIDIHGSKSIGKLSVFLERTWKKNKIRREIECSKNSLDNSMQEVQVSLGIMGAIKSNPNDSITSEHDEWKIDDKDIFISIMPGGYYADEDILGRGGFSTVVKGVYKKKINVAIKIPNNPSQIHNDPIKLRRYEREVRILSSVCHKHIGYFYGGIKTNRNGGPSYRIVTEILEMNLDRYIKENRNLSRDERFFIMEGVIQGLSYLHTIDIIHRDLKPKNIMIDKDGTPKIIDFGMSKGKEDRTASITAFTGTLAYAAPERLIKGQDSTPGSDMYSYGLTGFYVFKGEDPTEKNHDKVRQYFDDNISEDFRFKLFRKCVEVFVRNRISSSTLALFITLNENDIKQLGLELDLKQPTTSTATPTTLNSQQLSLNVQPDPRPPSTNSNHRESLQEKFFAFVEQGDVRQASKFYRKHTKPFLFANQNKTYLDKNARNANGLTAIEVAVKKYQWDMLEWLLENGFKCEGVEKIVGKAYGYDIVYVGQVWNGKEHGHGRVTWSDGVIYEGEWKDGWKHGHGRYTYADGSVKEGRWELNTFKG